MRFGRIATPDGMFFCTIDGAGDDEKYRVIRDTPFTTPNYTGQEYTKDQVRLLAPVLPSKIVAIGRNYADHVAEVFQKSAEHLPPTLFIKPPTAVVGPAPPLRFPTLPPRWNSKGNSRW